MLFDGALCAASQITASASALSLSASCSSLAQVSACARLPERRYSQMTNSRASIRMGPDVLHATRCKSRMRSAGCARATALVYSLSGLERGRLSRAQRRRQQQQQSCSEPGRSIPCPLARGRGVLQRLDKAQPLRIGHQKLRRSRMGLDGIHRVEGGLNGA